MPGQEERVSETFLRRERGDSLPLALSLGALLFALGLFPGALLAAGTIAFVEEGRPAGVFETGTPWRQGDGYLEGTGDGVLLADHDLGAKDFEIRAVLSLAAFDGSGASFEIGEGRLGLDGEGGTLFIEGIPKGTELEEIEPSAKSLRPGQPFEIRVLREGPRLRIWIDGRLLAERKVEKRALGSFGIRPKRGTARVYRFTAQGDLLDVGRRVRIDPAEFEALAREERIERAIEAGTEYLLSQFRGRLEAYVSSYAEHSDGAVAFEMYSLIVAGVPAEAPELEAGWDHLDRETVKGARTYDLSAAIFAHDAAIAQAEHDLILTSPGATPAELDAASRGHKRSMAALLETLLRGQNAHGAWRYDVRSTDYDHSCTQFAALALGAAARRGLRIPDDAWRRLAEHLLAGQQETGRETDRRAKLAPEGRADFAWSGARRGGKEKEKGAPKREAPGGTSVVPEVDPFIGAEGIVVRARGWEYTVPAKEKATWNMTAAGVSSLMLIYAHGGAALPPELRARVETGIRDGLGWMMENWEPHTTLYGLYSLEKVADIGGIGEFHGIDWFADSTEWLLDSQSRDGSWTSTGTGEIPRISTAFALLVLRRATTLLTRNPAERIIVTGSGELGREREESRSWVYLPRLDKAVSLPGLLRTVRMRPSAKLLAVLEECVRLYPEEHAPELIPELVEARARAAGTGAQAAIDRCLERAAGARHGAPDAYLAWHDRWAEVQALAGSEEGEPAPRLEEIYRGAGEDTRLKTAALLALIRRGGRGVLPALLPDLDHPDAAVRELVYRAVTSFHRDRPPPFDPGAAEEIRRAQAEAIRTWVAERG